MQPVNNRGPDQIFRTIFEEAEKKVESFQGNDIPRIYIGKATCGLAAGALDTQKALEKELEEQNIRAAILPVGCIGHCYAEPVVIIDNPESGLPPIFYHHVTPGKAKMLVKSFLVEGDPLFEHMLGAMQENDMVPHVMDYPRFNKEKRLVMEKCGIINPGEISEYISKGGYSVLTKVLQSPKEEIVNEVISSGLRGRGGAGFPIGKKWELIKDSDNPEKIIICNADEGDPGAYMDRTILESDPHQLLEGMAIAAYAVGAEKGIVYVRAEYPLAVETVRKAIIQAEELGLLGKSILGTDMNLEITVFQGSGAFVCGEETALIESIEGKRGMPRHRPPYPTQSGLQGIPTVINNVKTYSTLPYILKNGAVHFRKIGTKGSPGTAIFSVVGNVVHPGLVEIPMGVSLRTLIFDICGGIPGKKKFKAVQIGGPSGGCLPEDFLDTSIDFDSLKDAGAMMGSGGIVVMDEDTCMVNIARYFLDFTQKESCGKCTFCRIGNYQLLSILDRITKGEGRAEDIDQLETLSEDIKNGALCGLGKTSPNPVITSIRYFKDEYEAHIKEKRCPAGMCRELTAYYIDLEKCARGCDACVGSCPVEAIFTTKERKKGIDQTLCVKCGECMSACPVEYSAVMKVSPPEKAPKIERPKD
ncbi:MAG: SLBB domain-containing protein [Deltaproteobacteria bacterium]|nr:SLBB domain-containing protein [Deltaproteobacteria bacterium]